MSIARELVHKRAADEVLVTSVTAGSNGWTGRARLPDGHGFHADAAGRQAGYHDPLFVLEAFRQSCIAATHLLHGVPLGFQYTLRHYEFSVLDMSALQSDSGPAEFEFRTAVTSEFRPRDGAAVNGLELAATAVRGGTVAMELSGAFGWMSDERWRAMRAGASREAAPQPPRADPSTVGRRRSANVVIGEPVRDRDDGSFRAPVVVDVGNPTFFDHPLDHLPGGLILEACRQLSLALLGPRAALVLGPSRMRCDFYSFAELDSECVVALASAPERPAFEGLVLQSGQTRASIRLTFAPGDCPA